jgi:hypothetical protein
MGDQKSQGGLSSISAVNLHRYFGQIPKYLERFKIQKE